MFEIGNWCCVCMFAGLIDWWSVCACCCGGAFGGVVVVIGLVWWFAYGFSLFVLVIVYIIGGCSWCFSCCFEW